MIGDFVKIMIVLLANNVEVFNWFSKFLVLNRFCFSSSRPS